jgi:hypothetical protein
VLLTGERLHDLGRPVVTGTATSGDHDTAAALQLVLQMSVFADNLAELRAAQHRLHQARAARHAADQLRAVVAIGSAAAPATQPAAISRAPQRSTQP